MRVLLVMNWLGLGGIETGWLRAIPFLKSYGIDIDVCCLGGRSTLDSEFESFGCRIWRIQKSANCHSVARSFGALLKKTSYSLIHSQFGYTSGGFALAAGRHRIPLVVSVHSSEPLSLYSWRRYPFLSDARNAWLAWHRRLMRRNVRLVMGHSKTNLESYNGNWQLEPDRFRLVYNGIDTPRAGLLQKSEARRLLGIDQERVVLLHIGSFKREKNHLGLLQIFKRIVSKHPNSQLLLVGEGGLKKSILDEAARLKVLQSIRFEGAQMDVWKYYKAADVFLFPSITEGFGNALVESALAGTGIVASDIPAHRESVASSQHKFLFRLPNYEDAAELVLEQLHASHSHRNLWVSDSELHARENFSTERFAGQIHCVYRELLSEAA